MRIPDEVGSSYQRKLLVYKMLQEPRLTLATPGIYGCRDETSEIPWALRGSAGREKGECRGAQWRLPTHSRPPSRDALRWDYGAPCSGGSTG